MRWDILAFVLLITVVNASSGFIVFLKKEWSRRQLNALIALSAGLLLSIAVIDLVPEAIHTEPKSPVFVLLGIVVMFSFQQFIVPYFRFGEETRRYDKMGSSAWGVFIGMYIHNLFEGFSFVTSFELDVQLGVSVLLSLILHKIPEGVTTASIAFAMFQNKKKTIWTTVMLGLSTLLGSGAAMLLSGISSSEQMSATALSFTAGIFLYIASTNLLPAVKASGDRSVSFIFVAGILLYFLLNR